MTLALVGTLPVSTLNIGLQLGLASLQAQILDLQASITTLTLQFSAQVQVGLNIPDITGLLANLGTLKANLAASVSLANVITGGVAVNANLALQLGLINLELEAALAVQTAFQAGLNAGSLSAWSWGGPAAGFGAGMAQYTLHGWSGVKPDAPVSGLVIATESFDSWGSFSLNFNTGPSAKARPAGAPGTLTALGILSGADLNTGVLTLAESVKFFVIKLQGLAASLQFQIECTLGLHLPDVGVLANALAGIDLDLVLSNIINAKVDLGAEVASLNLQIQRLLDLSLSITTGLSASGGGLSFWTYTGTAAGLGRELQTALAGGLPSANGPQATAYGMAIACGLPSAWADFGLIFKT